MDDDGLMPVPTLPELHKQGLAEQNITETRTKSGKTTKSVSYRAKPEGQKILDEAMRYNGEYLRTHPEVSAQRTREAIIRARNPVD